MRDEITVLKVEPGKPPEIVSMANTLRAMQEMVGGYIEIVPLDDACLVCNDEGKLNGIFCPRKRKARRSGSCSVRWRNSMKNMFPLRCGSIWTASAGRRLRGPVPGVRKRTAVRSLPTVRSLQRRRRSRERRL